MDVHDRIEVVELALATRDRCVLEGWKTMRTVPVLVVGAEETQSKERDREVETTDNIQLTLSHT